MLCHTGHSLIHEHTHDETHHDETDDETEMSARSGVFVHVRERGRDRDREKHQERLPTCMCKGLRERMKVCVWVRAYRSEREKDTIFCKLDF